MVHVLKGLKCGLIIQPHLFVSKNWMCQKLWTDILDCDMFWLTAGLSSHTLIIAGPMFHRYWDYHCFLQGKLCAYMELWTSLS